MNYLFSYLINPINGNSIMDGIVIDAIIQTTKSKNTRLLLYKKGYVPSIGPSLVFFEDWPS